MAYRENPAQQMHFGDLELTYFKRRYHAKVGPKTIRSGPQLAASRTIRIYVLLEVCLVPLNLKTANEDSLAFAEKLN